MDEADHRYVELQVEITAEIMVHTIDQYVEYRCSSRPWLGCRRKEWLSLSAKPDTHQTLWVAE